MVMVDTFAMDEQSELIANVRRAAKRAAPNAADQDDLAQETLLRVWQRDPAQFDGGNISAGRGLIRTILRRLRIDLWRRRRRQGATVRDDGVDPFDALQGQELRLVVRDLVERLPSAQRDAVQMRFREGLTFQEIAERQGVPLNTALGRVHDAIKRMRQQLEALDEPREQG